MPNNNPINENCNLIQNNNINEMQICELHKMNIINYCINCNKYFCNQCMNPFNEGNNHISHLIIPTSKINDSIDMRQIINEFKKKITELENENQILKNNSNNNSNLSKIIQLMEEIKKKDKEITEIKSRYPFEIKEGEKLMSIIFISVDQKIHHSVICKNTDIFAKIENKLYDDMPEYRDTNNFFMIGSRVINKYRSLEENNIHNSDIILLKQYDEED